LSRQAGPQPRRQRDQLDQRQGAGCGDKREQPARRLAQEPGHGTGRKGEQEEREKLDGKIGQAVSHTAAPDENRKGEKDSDAKVRAVRQRHEGPPEGIESKNPATNGNRAFDCVLEIQEPSIVGSARLAASATARPRRTVSRNAKDQAIARHDAWINEPRGGREIARILVSALRGPAITCERSGEKQAN
jgi:hypothetical protein